MDVIKIKSSVTIRTHQDKTSEQTAIKDKLLHPKKVDRKIEKKTDLKISHHGNLCLYTKAMIKFTPLRHLR